MLAGRAALARRLRCRRPLVIAHRVARRHDTSGSSLTTGCLRHEIGCSGLRENDFLSDLRMTSGHRVLLASHSGYFRFIFSSGTADASSPCLSLPEADAAAFVAFVYIGKCTLDHSLVPSLAQVATFLDAPEFQSAVAKELSKDVSARWRFEAVDFGEQLEMRKLVEHAVGMGKEAVKAGRLASQLLSEAEKVLKAFRLIGPGMFFALRREEACEPMVQLLLSSGRRQLVLSTRVRNT